VIKLLLKFIAHIASQARRQEALHKGSYAQATIEWTWSNGEYLLLLARCPTFARSILPWKAAAKVVIRSSSLNVLSHEEHYALGILQNNITIDVT